MKRKLGSLIPPIKKRKFKYKYTPDMKNKSVPLHYIYDRLATDKQIEELEIQLELRNNVYSNMGQDNWLLINSLLSIDKIELDRIVFEMIDNNYSIYYINEEIELFLDEH